MTMSDMNSVQPDDVSDKSETELNPPESKDKTEDKVAYDTYKKLLGEKKKRDEEVSALAQRLKSYEEKELEASGKHSELIESLRSQLKEKDESLSGLKKEIETREKKEAWNTVTSQIKDAAMSEGCMSPDKLLKLLDKSDLKALEVMEESGKIKVNTDDLKRLMEKARKENEFLFKKPDPKINDLTPTNQIQKPKASLRDGLKNIY
jgi:hypothetical protein